MCSFAFAGTGAPRDRRQPEAGVTLVEILVVLSIVAVLAGITALSLPATTRIASLRQEAELLAARLDIAAEQSLVFGRAAALDWSGDSYVFVEQTQDGWVAHSNPNLGDRHHIAGTLSLQEPGGDVDKGRVHLLSDLSVPAGGPRMFRIASGSSDIELRFDGASAQVIAK